MIYLRGGCTGDVRLDTCRDIVCDIGCDTSIDGGCCTPDIGVCNDTGMDICPSSNSCEMGCFSSCIVVREYCLIIRVEI